MHTVEIFTDGACSGNPGPGGWGAILRMGEHYKELSGGMCHNQQPHGADSRYYGAFRPQAALSRYPHHRQQICLRQHIKGLGGRLEKAWLGKGGQKARTQCRPVGKVP